MLGPEPHRPKQPQDLTTMFGGAIPARVSRVSNDPWRLQVRLVQTRISDVSELELRMEVIIVEIELDEKGRGLGEFLGLECE